MRCPGCQRETVWEDNPWRPFCSERCQLIDLGQWVSGAYAIPLFEESDGLAEPDSTAEPDGPAEPDVFD